MHNSHNHNHHRRHTTAAVISVCVAALLLILTTLTGCTRAHKPELQQGNVVTDPMLAAIELGMSRREVQSLLGTPLITDAFHQNRWDYYYRLVPDNKIKNTGVIETRITVFFDDDKLIKVEGNTVPIGTSSASEE